MNNSNLPFFANTFNLSKRGFSCTLVGIQCNLDVSNSIVSYFLRVSSVFFRKQNKFYFASFNSEILVRYCYFSHGNQISAFPLGNTFYAFSQGGQHPTKTRNVFIFFRSFLLTLRAFHFCRVLGTGGERKSAHCFRRFPSVDFSGFWSCYKNVH